MRFVAGGGRSAVKQRAPPASNTNVQAGQCLETTITVSPGKCYSVVGVGLPTAQNLDLALVRGIAVPGVPPVVAAADKSVGPTAV
ncbi:MAG: hypothetical protein K0R38_6749 [Polyangiaceae bacterium]|nr:hypothetical protein [Polyangiaceae bacterium]